MNSSLLLSLLDTSFTLTLTLTLTFSLSMLVSNIKSLILLFVIAIFEKDVEKDRNLCNFTISL